MPKRGRSSRDTLTGGSGDVNPQSLVLSHVTETAPDTFTSQTLALPIPRLPIQKGRALVMEIQRVWFMFVNSGYVSNTTTNITAALTTNPGANDNNSVQNGNGLGLFQDPRTICQATRLFVALATGGGAGIAFEYNDAIREVDLTDDAGHGFLVATDNLFLCCSSVGTASNSTVACRFTYRFKDVALEEYIGIVQSQQ